MSHYYDFQREFWNGMNRIYCYNTEVLFGMKQYYEFKRK